MPPADVTHDALLGGSLSLAQPRTGYRVNVDSLLLASFAAVGRPAKLAVDLGAGVGAIGLVLVHRSAVRGVVLVEREPELVLLARANLEQNGLSGSVEERDLERHGLPPALVQRAELVVCNPPFYPPATGTPARRSVTARSGELAPFMRAARLALSGPRARAVFCYPSAALAELLACARAERLQPKRLRLVHPRAGEPARLALVELRLAKPGGLVVEPPLIEWSRARVRSSELARIVRGRFGPAHG